MKNEQAIFEKILSLNEAEYKLIFSIEKGKQKLEIYQYENYRWLNLDGCLLQSLLDINLPNKILLPNVEAMLLSLLFVENPKKILNLGLGGAALERFLLTSFPNLKMAAVELNEEVINAAKKYFCLPNQVSLHHCSALNFLKKESDLSDIIFCDIFYKEKHSACLNNAEFYRHAGRSLNPEGLMVINLSPENEAEMLELLLPIRATFKWVSLMTIPCCTNIIVFAGFERPPEMSVIHARALSVNNKFSIDLKYLIDGLSVLPSRVS